MNVNLGQDTIEDRIYCMCNMEPLSKLFFAVSCALDLEKWHYNYTKKEDTQREIITKEKVSYSSSYVSSTSISSSSSVSVSTKVHQKKKTLDQNKTELIMTSDEEEVEEEKHKRKDEIDVCDETICKSLRVCVCMKEKTKKSSRSRVCVGSGSVAVPRLPSRQQTLDEMLGLDNIEKSMKNTRSLIKVRSCEDVDSGSDTDEDVQNVETQSPSPSPPSLPKPNDHDKQFE